MGMYIFILVLTFAYTFVFYWFIKRIFYQHFIIRRLHKGNIVIKVDKKIESKIMIKHRPKDKKTFMDKLEKLLSDASVDMEGKKLVIMTSLSSIIAFVFTLILIKSILIALMLLILIPMSVFFLLNHLKAKRVKLFTSQLGEVVDFLSSSLKSGYSLMQALNMIVMDGSPPASEEFKRTLDDIRLGKSYDEAFDNLAERNPIEDIEILTTAILINKETGGNLSHILDTVSRTIRERQRLLNEVKSLTAQGRLSGIILALLPVAILLFMYIINPDYVKPLFTTTLGKMMILSGLFSEVIGAFFIKIIINIDR